MLCWTSVSSTFEKTHFDWNITFSSGTCVHVDVIYQSFRWYIITNNGNFGGRRAGHEGGRALNVGIGIGTNEILESYIGLLSGYWDDNLIICCLRISKKSIHVSFPHDSWYNLRSLGRVGDLKKCVNWMYVWLNACIIKTPLSWIFNGRSGMPPHQSKSPYTDQTLYKPQIALHVKASSTSYAGLWKKSCIVFGFFEEEQNALADICEIMRLLLKAGGGPHRWQIEVLSN